MGERLLCKQEVIGSIPFTSTISVVGCGKASSIEIFGIRFLFASEVMTLPLRFVD